MTFSLEELLEHIRQSGAELGAEETPDTFTSYDYAEFIGLSQDTARKRLRKLVRAGVVEPVKIKRRTVHGHLMTVGGYRLIGEDHS